jgi:hypothetical protein
MKPHSTRTDETWVRYRPVDKSRWSTVLRDDDTLATKKWKPVKTITREKTVGSIIGERSSWVFRRIGFSCEKCKFPCEEQQDIDQRQPEKKETSASRVVPRASPWWERKMKPSLLRGIRSWWSRCKEKAKWGDDIGTVAHNEFNLGKVYELNRCNICIVWSWWWRIVGTCLELDC